VSVALVDWLCVGLFRVGCVCRESVHFFHYWYFCGSLQSV
jgi:hypothetical protein